MREAPPAGLPGWRRAVLGTVVLGLGFALGAPPGRTTPPGPVVRIDGEVARPGWYELGAAGLGEGLLTQLGEAGVHLGQELGLVGRAWAAAGAPVEGPGAPPEGSGAPVERPGAPPEGSGDAASLAALAHAVSRAGGAPLHGANGLPRDGGRVLAPGGSAGEVRTEVAASAAGAPPASAGGSDPPAGRAAPAADAPIGERVVVRGGWALFDRPDPGELVVAGPAGDPRVDLNRASLAELEALPRVGPVLAARIVAGRPYRRLADLDRVKGVGPATLEQLRPRVRW